jgi:hypothetical protein
VISKNKKIIREKINEMLISQGKQQAVIHCDNLISVLREILQSVQMSNTQWKILVSIADVEKNSFIDFNLFMRLVETSAKQSTSHPKKLMK